MQRLKLKEIQLKDFMNVEKGKICVEEESHIVGIYGQNCSGKSTVVRALKIAHSLFCSAGRGLDPEENKYVITAGKTKATISFIFSTGEGVLTYSFSIRKNRTNDNVSISYECVSFKSDDGKNDFSEEVRKQTYIKDIQTISSGDVELEKKLLEHYKEKDVAHRSFFSDHPSHLIKEMTAFFQNMFFLDADIEGDLRGTHQNSFFLRYNDSAYMFPFLDSSLMNTGANFDELDEPDVYNDPSLLSYLRAKNPNACLDSSIAVRNCIHAVVEKAIQEANAIIKEIAPEMSLLDLELEGYEVRLFSSRNGEKLPFDYESYGKKKLYKIALELRHIIEDENCTLVVDEIDEGIYEYLLGKILLFTRKRSKGLLIFTSHNLYPLEVIGKASIWFSTTDPKHRYTRMKNIRKGDNPRDKYINALFNDKWNLAGNIDEKRIAHAFKHFSNDYGVKDE